MDREVITVSSCMLTAINRILKKYGSTREELKTIIVNAAFDREITEVQAEHLIKIFGLKEV